jgi:alpha-beta hydrolase superfamily lysophospholipase
MDTGNNLFTKFDLSTRSGVLQAYHWAAAGGAEISVVCIILHGIMVHASSYSNVAESMAAAGIEVLSVDLPGHGDSPGQRWDMGEREDQFVAIDALLTMAQVKYPGHKIAVFAHSIGGNIALDYRSRGKGRRIPDLYVILSPWLTLAVDIPAWLPPAVRVIDKIKPTYTLHQTVQRSEINSSMFDVEPDEAGDVTLGISAQTAIDAWDAAKQLVSEREEPGLLSPLVLMHGTADAICDIEGSRLFAELNKDSDITLAEFDGYPHELHDGDTAHDGKIPVNYAISKIRELSDRSKLIGSDNT